MAKKAITGRGKIDLLKDVHYIKLVGKTKAGDDVMIELENAMCTSDLELAFDEKNDVVAEMTYIGLYDDEKLASGDRTEPWKITYDDANLEGSECIILGACRVSAGSSSMDAQPIGLVRGGGVFKVTREYREQRADGDPGPVKGRVQLEEARPELTVRTFEWLPHVDKLWAGVDVGAAV